MHEITNLRDFGLHLFRVRELDLFLTKMNTNLQTSTARLRIVYQVRSIIGENKVFSIVIAPIKSCGSPAVPVS